MEYALLLFCLLAAIMLAGVVLHASLPIVEYRPVTRRRWFRRLRAW